MSKPTFAERCLLAEHFLPDAPYRAMLTQLHAEMLAALAEQPAQQQQEPVGALILGGVVDTSDGPEYEEWDIEWNHKAIESLQERLVTYNPVTLNIYTSPPAQQEPVQRYSPDGEGGMEVDSLGAWMKFTSPPAQRKPLTDMQVDGEWILVRDLDTNDVEKSRLFARAIEAAHGIKENT